VAAATALCLSACGPAPSAEFATARQLLQQEPADARGAEPHLLRAAEAGLPAAAYHLGLLLRRGAPGVARDLPAARRWLQRAADAQLADARFMLAQMLVRGEGGPVDLAGARRLLEQAAEQEHAEADLQLAMAYQRGELGLAPDAEQAQHYLMEAQHAMKERLPPP
jgi:TPR repeat protein